MGRAGTLVGRVGTLVGRVGTLVGRAGTQEGRVWTLLNAVCSDTSVIVSLPWLGFTVFFGKGMWEVHAFIAP